MTLTLTRKEEAAVLRRRLAKGRAKIAGPKLAAPNTGKADRGRVRDNAYLAYLRRQPCCVGHILGDGCSGPTDPAHIRFSDFKAGRVNPGKSRKSDDRWALPLCRKHHDAQHAAGNERRWWSEVGLDPNFECQSRYAAFLASGGPA